jgi:hypothetical protein
MASPKQIDRIKADVDKGMSANQIQKDLQKNHMGMKRQKLLAYVREFKGQPAPKEPQKYTPTKYRRARAIPHVEIGKKIAVYGTVHGESKRIQMYGSGRNLYSAMKFAGKYPPKKRFLTASASDIVSNPEDYLDMDEEWDRKEVESQ